MHLKSLTQRWAIYGIGIPLLILIGLDFGFAFAIKNYFYSSAEQYMQSSISTVSDLLLRYADDSTRNLNTEIQNLVENYSAKDNIELMAINHRGNVVLTSSGFAVPFEEKMPDYVAALRSVDGTGRYIGNLFGGEKVLAVSVLVPTLDSEYSAMRYVVSLEKVDRAILVLVLCFTAFCVFIIIFMTISGTYFVRSIAIPVREIGAAARKIASGDMRVRIEKKSNDELGELCETINFMADELAKTEQIKNDFISSVSHELRTPLTAIKGWSETLMASASPQDIELARTGLGVIAAETERLSGMVEELLDFSRMQNGRFTMNKAKIDILAELGEAVLIYEQRARREGKTIRYDEPEMLPFVYGDKNRLRQVFINIIDNALKYSDSGATVTVRASVEGRFISIAITDTGCGISMEDLPFVKQKFYKANQTQRGSGIGLAVANEIVQMHNGELMIESTKNVSTTVTIRLPVYREEQPTQEGSTETVQPLDATLVMPAEPLPMDQKYKQTEENVSQSEADAGSAIDQDATG